jgi:hypothetical protein
MTRCSNDSGELARHFATPGVRLGRYKQMRFRGTITVLMQLTTARLVALPQTLADLAIPEMIEFLVLLLMALMVRHEQLAKLDQPTLQSLGLSRPTAHL